MADQHLHQEETVIISPETMVETQSPSGWSNPKIVFPPVNHEGLDHISSSGSESPHGDVKEIDIERVAPPSSSPLPTPRPMMPTVEEGGWWEAGIQLLRFKIAGFNSTFRKCVESRGFPVSFRSYFPPLAGSLMIVLLILRFRRRRRIQRENISDLIRFVREKEEEKMLKINELVHQVVRMNELLQALASRHRS